MRPASVLFQGTPGYDHSWLSRSILAARIALAILSSVERGNEDGFGVADTPRQRCVHFYSLWFEKKAAEISGSTRGQMFSGVPAHDTVR
jgi:hypothetical protein